MTTGQDYAEMHRKEIERAGSLVERIADAAASRVLNHAEASTIFGEPTTQGDRTVIPVGRVAARYAFGGGEGYGIGEDVGSEGAGGGGGGGGGAMLQVRPVGYIEVTAQESNFVPIVDASAIALRSATIWSIVGLVAVIGLFRYLSSRDDRAE